MAHYGLPLPSNPTSELDHYWARHVLADEQALFERLCKTQPMTDEQQLVFDSVVGSVGATAQAVATAAHHRGRRRQGREHKGSDDDDEGDDEGQPLPAALYLLLASAGCGKTATARKIAAYCRAQGHVVLICASTAIAALNFPHDATTTHSLFGVPVVEDFERDLHEEALECFMGSERSVCDISFFYFYFLLHLYIFFLLLLDEL